MNLTVLTWNVRNAATADLRAKILSYLSHITSTSSSSSSLFIFLLQEHALDGPAIEDLQSSTSYQIFSTKYLLILLPQPLFSLLDSPPLVHPSTDGRILTLHLSIPNTLPLEIVNVYAPAEDRERKRFFNSFTFPHRPHHLTLLAGDLNDCPNLEVDRKGQKGRKSYWRELTSRFPVSLSDAVRLRHPSRALFTRPHYYNKNVVSWSRIDHILISTKQKSKLRDAYIRFDKPCSDHRAVIAVVTLPDPSNHPSLPTTSSFSARIHPSLFSEPTFATAFNDWFSSSLQPLLHDLPPDYRWEASKKKIARFATQFSYKRYRAKEERRQFLELQLSELENSEDSPSSIATNWHPLQQELDTLNKENANNLFLRSSIPLYPDSNSSARALRERLAARKSSSTFTSLQLADGTQTTDIETALEHAHSHFAQQFTPSPRDSSEIENSRRNFLSPIETSLPSSDPRFARRWDPQDAARLDLPLTPEEIAEAIASAPSSSSPGLLGLPYEFYKQNSNLLSQELADAFNAAWERGFLQPSQTEARVRLLFKSQKPNADASLLSHYRPISLRETDYRILARVLVKRLNPLLQRSIPRNQVGFVPGRESSDAGLHLQLLVEEIKASNLPHAALLSLDQEKAYDLVDHEWILASYEAFGASPRFLSLLSSLYDAQRLVARYNINGFFTAPVPLRCGLPQGCPLSCASWLLSFQPFLDSLARRRIVLTLTSPITTTRSEILTHLAFADDSVLAVDSVSTSLPLLETLAIDWRLATNGRLNTSKTTAFAIGSEARQDPVANLLVWTPDDEFTTWAGFPISLTPQPDQYYGLLLDKISRRCSRASQLYNSARTRALYANSHILSLSLHSLTFYPAPDSFLTKLRSNLLDFVWGYKRHPVSKEIVFLPIKKGGLGLIDPFALNSANNLRRLNSLLTNSHSLSSTLLLNSFHRHFSLNKPHSLFTLNPWSLLRKNPLRSSHPLWSSLAKTASSLAFSSLSLDLPALSTSNILSLPPSLFLSHPSLNSIPLIAELYARNRSTITTLQPSYGLLASKPQGLKFARKIWQEFVPSHPILSRHFPSPSIPIPLPTPTLPAPYSHRFYDLPPTFSTSEARAQIEAARPSAQLDQKFERIFPSFPSSEALVRRTWKWIHSPPATAREAETHWKILHNGIMTRSQLAHFAEGAVSTCIFCASASDDVVHALFECEYSKEYWSSLLDLLSTSLSEAFTPSTFSADEILLGLPTLRHLVDDRDTLTLRAIVAVAIQTLVDTRWSRIKSDPLLSSPSPSDLAVKTVEGYIRRLS